MQELIRGFDMQFGFLTCLKLNLYAFKRWILALISTKEIFGLISIAVIQFRNINYDFDLQKPEEWVIPLRDQQIKEIEDKKAVFRAEFSREDQKAVWTFKRDEIFNGPKYSIERLADEDGKMVVHQLTINKPMHKVNLIFIFKS